MKPVHTDIDQPKTWIKYNSKLCKECTGACCSLEVEVRASDLSRMGVADEYELEENPKKVAKNLKKEGIIDHFSQKKGIFSINRMANGDCIYLDSHLRRCTIYEQRPDTCRNHPQIGPKPGYCAFTQK